MEKRNTLLLTVIAIATLLVALVGATFAYFVTDVEETDLDKPEVVDRSALFNSVGTAMMLNVSSEDMINTMAGQNFASNQGSLSVKYNAGGTRETSCQYDINFRWTSSDKYMAHSGYYEGDTFIQNEGKEFTTMVSTTIESSTGSGQTTTSFINDIENDENHEIDFSLLKGCDTLLGCKIGSGVVYSNTNEVDKPTVVTWTFKNTIYNLGANQMDETYGIANKDYSGEFFVTNVNC